MDGLEDTDTSQDEVDSSPGGISKFRKYGRNAAATAADAPDKTPQGAHGNAQGIANGGGSRLAPSEEPGSYATTDDESVGPGGAHQNSINSSHMLGQAAKGRRPRTKLQVQTNASSPQGASSTATAEDGPGYQPSSHSHAPDKLHNSADHAAAVTASTATATDCSAAVTAAGEGGDGTGAAAGATVSTKAKRRVRAQVSSKAKGEAASVLIEGGVSGASSSADATASSAPVAATPTSPWDSELDQWYIRLFYIVCVFGIKESQI